MNENKHYIQWKDLYLLLSLFLLGCLPVCLQAQTEDRLSPRMLKGLTLEELMNVEVTSVTKSPEKLSEAASAIQVLTGDDIRRSGALRLPEALRLAPNLQVAQTNAHDWAITARGFNGAPLLSNTLSNKLLVMTDGRSVYTPLFGGVFWDVQNVVLEDVDRIEVVSGPGGTLWGANAVNGVINVITKSARETQGLYATVAAGTLLQDQAALRYGFQFDSTLFCRVYGQRFDQHSTQHLDGADAQDAWGMSQGGFRMDYMPSQRSTLTLQGDLYDGKENNYPRAGVNGQNILGRWTRRFSPQSELIVQAYYDRTWRDLPLQEFRQTLQTYDLDLEYHFPLGKRQQIVCGLGYRLMDDAVRNSDRVTFNPDRRILELFNEFVQDQIELLAGRLMLTIGTKLLHNDYSGLEWQPSARLAWTPTETQTIWTAVSRAVRTPARLDADAITPNIMTRNREFDSEKVVAYELGYRIRPLEQVSLSIAAFYHDYDDLRSINVNPHPPTPFLFANDQEAQSWGLEISGNFFARPWWRLRGGFTFLDNQFSAKSPAVSPISVIFESIDPHNQALLQSIMDLPGNFQLDVVGRYVDLLPATPSLTIPAYLTLDIRLAWIFKAFRFSIVGQNLGEEAHREFGSRQIPRSLYLKTAFHF